MPSFKEMVVYGFALSVCMVLSMFITILLRGHVTGFISHEAMRYGGIEISIEDELEEEEHTCSGNKILQTLYQASDAYHRKLKHPPNQSNYSSLVHVDPSTGLFSVKGCNLREFETCDIWQCFSRLPNRWGDSNTDNKFRLLFHRMYPLDVFSTSLGHESMTFVSSNGVKRARINGSSTGWVFWAGQHWSDVEVVGDFSACRGMDASRETEEGTRLSLRFICDPRGGFKELHSSGIGVFHTGISPMCKDYSKRFQGQLPGRDSHEMIPDVVVFDSGMWNMFSYNVSSLTSSLLAFSRKLSETRLDGKMKRAIYFGPISPIHEKLTESWRIKQWNEDRNRTRKINNHVHRELRKILAVDYIDSELLYTISKEAKIATHANDAFHQSWQFNHMYTQLLLNVICND